MKLTEPEPSTPTVVRCVIQGYVLFVHFHYFTCDDLKAKMMAEFLSFIFQLNLLYEI